MDLSSFIGSQLFRGVGRAVLRSGSRARLSILIYHRVLPEPDPMLDDEIDASIFALHMDALAQAFNVIPLSDAVARLGAGTLPPRAACITFDDGYANNVTIALPILQQRSLPACFFIATGFINGACMWNDVVIEALRDSDAVTLDLGSIGLGIHDLTEPTDRRAAMRKILPELKKLGPDARDESIAGLIEIAGVERATGKMMSADQVRTLAAAGMEIGGHTVNHPILATLNKQRARDEMAACKDELEAIARQPVRNFAYPNGRPRVDFTDEHVKLAEDIGYSLAVTTARGTAVHGCNPFLLPRFTPWDRTSARFTLRLFQNALQDLNPVA